MNKLNKLLIVFAMLFAFANFNSAQTQRENQLGTLCEKYRDYNDCKEYLKDYPNGKNAGVAKTVVDAYEANSNKNTTKKTVEDQYWDAVKSSTDKADFKSYLKEYPNGKYAAVARLKIKQKSGATNSPVAVSISGKQTDSQFLNSWAAEIGKKLPMTKGILKLTKVSAHCPAGCETKFPDTYLGFDATMPNYTKQEMNVDKLYEYVTNQFTADYCQSDGYKKRNLVVRFFIRDKNGEIAANTLIKRERCKTITNLSYSKDHFLNNNLPPENSPPANQTNAKYLNSWAAEVRVDLPEMVGGFQLTDATSRCPEDCQEKSSLNYLNLNFSMVGDQKTMPMDDLEKSLKTTLLVEYCKSDAISRDITLGVYLSERNPGLRYNFWIYPSDCSAKTTK